MLKTGIETDVAICVQIKESMGKNGNIHIVGFRLSLTSEMFYSSSAA